MTSEFFRTQHELTEPPLRQKASLHGNVGHQPPQGPSAACLHASAGPSEWDTAERACVMRDTRAALRPEVSSSACPHYSLLCSSNALLLSAGLVLLAAFPAPAGINASIIRSIRHWNGWADSHHFAACSDVAGVRCKASLPVKWKK